MKKNITFGLYKYLKENVTEEKIIESATIKPDVKIETKVEEKKAEKVDKKPDEKVETIEGKIPAKPSEYSEKDIKQLKEQDEKAEKVLGEFADEKVAKELANSKKGQAVQDPETRKWKVLVKEAKGDGPSLDDVNDAWLAMSEEEQKAALKATGSHQDDTGMLISDMGGSQQDVMVDWVMVNKLNVTKEWLKKKNNEAKEEVAVDDGSSAKKDLKSVLRKIHKATTEDEVDTALDKLAKSFVKHDIDPAKVAIIKDEADRKIKKLESGDKAAEPEAKTEEAEEEIDNLVESIIKEGINATIQTDDQEVKIQTNDDGSVKTTVTDKVVEEEVAADPVEAPTVTEDPLTAVEDTNMPTDEEIEDNYSEGEKISSYESKLEEAIKAKNYVGISKYSLKLQEISSKKKVKANEAISIARARKREEHDDHLTDPERQAIVDAYKKANPEKELPKNMTDAYIKILFESKINEKTTQADILFDEIMGVIEKSKLPADQVKAALDMVVSTLHLDESKKKVNEDGGGADSYTMGFAISVQKSLKDILGVDVKIDKITNKLNATDRLGLESLKQAMEESDSHILKQFLNMILEAKSG